MITFVGAGPGAEDLITVRGTAAVTVRGHRDLCGISCESRSFVTVQERMRDL